jgi:Ca2+:H+ antiporter
VAPRPWAKSSIITVCLGWLSGGALHLFHEVLPLGVDAGFTVGLGVALFTLMLGCVFSVVRFADALADYLREPYSTLVLTLSMTVIEVCLMLRVMLAGTENTTMLRDTVFAVLMISMNCLVGLALTAGGYRHREQVFNLRGALSFLQLIVPLSLLVLIMPNYTQSSAGPTLAPHQATYLGGLCVIVYLLFLVLQTGRHHSYFDHLEAAITDGNCSHGMISDQHFTWTAVILLAGGLVVSLLSVVLLSPFLAEAINYGIDEMRAPSALGGLIIASLGLISEGVGAFRAALANRIQRAVNICLGSALSTIGLTVPTVLMAAGYLGMELPLGLGGTNATLLLATLLVAVLTFVSGTANVLQGVIHLMLFLGYIIFILFP